MESSVVVRERLVFTPDEIDKSLRFRCKNKKKKKKSDSEGLGFELYEGRQGTWGRDRPNKVKSNFSSSDLHHHS